jgi:hypothetical protein
MIIPALTIFFGKGPNTIDKWIYSRDVMFSNIALLFYYYFAKETEAEYFFPIIIILPYLIYLTV